MTDDAVDLGIDDLTDPVEVGAGGFGTVYRARQQSLRRDVAVKVVTSTVKDRKVRIRFEREIQAMGMLSGHPNIVTVYDSGFTSGGRPYILMDYMERGSLGDRLDEDGAIPWPEAAQIMVMVCGALETAHQAGILHRDLKPENVLVSGYGEPKLGDFGIARLKGGPETGTASLTASIEHVAPELLDAQKPAVGSDLYALGSTMFKLLTGEAAYVRSTDEGIVPALSRIKDDPVPDLRQRGVPDQIAQVVERGMAKAPHDRFASAAEMGRAIQRAQQALGQLPTALPVREDEAARARESTRTLNSDDIARSIEDIRASGGAAATGPTGPPGAPPGGGPPAGGPPAGSAPAGPPMPGSPAQHTGPSSGQTAPQGRQPGGPPPPQQGAGRQWSGQPAQPSRSPRPWAMILTGVGVVVVLASIGGAVALSLGEDTPGTEPPVTEPDPEVTPTTPTPTPTPEPEPTATPYAAYERLTDQSDVLTVDVPRPWSDVDDSAWTVDGQEVGQQIAASSDLDAFRSTWTTPGVIFGASEQLASSLTPEELADAISWDQCTYEGREPYNDPVYSGVRDEYTNCGNTGTGYTVIAGWPSDQDRLVLVQFQAVAERDEDALARVLDTFVHVEDQGVEDQAEASPPEE